MGVFGLVFSILLLASAPYIGQAAQWRVPCQLSKNERRVISKLTHMREPLYAILTGAKTCMSLNPHTILIRYANGDIRIFGIDNSRIALSDAEKNNDEYVPSSQAQDISYERYYANNEQEKLIGQFKDLWYSALLPDNLTAETLAQADVLVQDMFMTIPTIEIPPSDYISLGLRGNRYLSIIENLHSLTPDQEINFMKGYLETSSPAILTRTEDMPSDSDKQVAVQKILGLYESSHDPKTLPLITSVSKEIKMIDPEAYMRLIDLGAIYKENP